MGDRDNFDQLCDHMLNGISVIKDLCIQLEKKKMDIDFVVGKISHRCGSMEAAINMLRAKVKRKGDSVNSD